MVLELDPWRSTSPVRTWAARKSTTSPRPGRSSGRRNQFRFPATRASAGLDTGAMVPLPSTSGVTDLDGRVGSARRTPPAVRCGSVVECDLVGDVVAVLLGVEPAP